jgi:hypothetical protein
LQVFDKPTPDETVIDIWMSVLAPYSLRQVKSALRHHVSKSKFAPKPADIIEIINQQDGRPSSDEAWPIALQAADEAATAVWTAEIEQAWFHCYPVFEQGDEVGARMTFRQHYGRLVNEARANGMPVKWNVSLGHDPDLRKNALVQAERQGLIGHERVENLLPAPEPTGDGQHVAALVGYDKKTNEEPSADFKANVAKLRAELNKAVPDRKAEARAWKKAVEEQRRIELAEQQRLLEEARDNYQQTEVNHGQMERTRPAASG